MTLIFNIDKEYGYTIYIYSRFLLIQYPCCQKNNIGFTEYWIKHRTNFSPFQTKRIRYFNSNLYSYYYEVGRNVRKHANFEFIHFMTKWLSKEKKYQQLWMKVWQIAFDSQKQKNMHFRHKMILDWYWIKRKWNIFMLDY